MSNMAEWQGTNMTPFQNALRNLMVGMFTKDGELERKFDEKKLSLKSVEDYVYKKAKATATGNRYCASDDEVAGWVVDCINGIELPKKEKAEAKEEKEEAIEAEEKPKEAPKKPVKAKKNEKTVVDDGSVQLSLFDL